jgi:hypothetical protein
MSFNPRPRAAGDAVLQAKAADVLLFQSTPARGGRRRNWVRRTQDDMFQSTPARGGRRRSSKRCQYSYLEHRFREPDHLNVLSKCTLPIRGR